MSVSPFAEPSRPAVAPPQVHRVDFLLEPGGLRAKITCTGNDLADCHQGCDRCEEACTCEEFRPVNVGRCLAVEFWNTAGAVHEYFQGRVPAEEVPALAGPVNVAWDPRDEAWVWSYPGRAVVDLPALL